ncbi:MAG: MmgE/PrpD family protein [Deltaproteobacteria bacterium]|nr:MmgE/PrpD family protein [Deltaproteobacteria bacterium]
MNASAALARHVARTRFEDLPPAVVEVTKKSILDAVGVSLAAGTLGEGCKAFVDVARAAGGRGESTLLGFGAKATAIMAAFANGALAHALDFEDAHDGSLSHPNAPTVPAALALAEAAGGVSGRELITAVAVGCDLACRLGMAVMNEERFESGWYFPPIFGAFGAAAASSKVLRLPEEQVLDALALTLCQATCTAEITASPRSVLRSVRDAFAAKAGVLSALLAREGVAAFDEPFEGAAGLFRLYAGGRYDAAALTRGLGEVFEGEHVSFKPWPSCRFTHSYIELCLALRAAGEVSLEEIREIRAVVGPSQRALCEPLERKRRPETGIDAKFSVPFVIATALAHGRVDLEHFEPTALADPRVLALAEKVTCVVDPERTVHEAARGVLEVETAKGTLVKAIELPCGDPKKPMTTEQLVAKFMACAGYAPRRFERGERERAVELLLGLEEVEDVARLTAVL